MKIATYRKALTAVLGAIATIVSLNLVSGTARDLLVAILAVATAAGVYAVPNQPPTPVADPHPASDTLAVKTAPRIP